MRKEKYWASGLLFLVMTVSTTAKADPIHYTEISPELVQCEYDQHNNVVLKIGSAVIIGVPSRHNSEGYYVECLKQLTFAKAGREVMNFEIGEADLDRNQTLKITRGPSPAPSVPLVTGNLLSVDEVRELLIMLNKIKVAEGLEMPRVVAGIAADRLERVLTQAGHRGAPPTYEDSHVVGAGAANSAEGAASSDSMGPPTTAAAAD